MSEDKIKRRRFLADILFAGGALSAAALLARAAIPQKPDPQPAGAVVCPSPVATPQLGGEPSPPQPDPASIRGDFKVPQPVTPTLLVGGQAKLPVRKPKK